MPTNYTYPGVYLEELPSGVRTIAGVSTSNTAFVGFFKKGPTDTATRIESFGDFVDRAVPPDHVGGDPRHLPGKGGSQPRRLGQSAPDRH